MSTWVTRNADQGGVNQVVRVTRLIQGHICVPSLCQAKGQELDSPDAEKDRQGVSYWGPRQEQGLRQSRSRLELPQAVRC